MPALAWGVVLPRTVWNHLMKYGTSCSASATSRNARTAGIWTYFCNLRVHGGLGDGSGDHATGAGGNHHAPFDLAVLKFFDALDAHIATFDAFLLELREVSIRGDVNCIRDDEAESVCQSREMIMRARN